MSDYLQTLKDGLASLNIELDAKTEARLIAYLELLIKWNKAYNLTAVRDPEQMVRRHLLDSLSVLPWIQSGDYLDVGAGAGLPSIPLSIVYPGARFHAIDSNGKKTRFMQQAQIELGLENFSVSCERVQQHRTDTVYRGILSRAFAAASDIVDWCQHLMGPDTQIMAMKAVVDDAELSQLPKPFKVVGLHPLRVPGLDETRQLLIIRNAGADARAQEDKTID